jgi:hypothetical protein
MGERGSVGCRPIIMIQKRSRMTYHGSSLLLLASCIAQRLHFGILPVVCDLPSAPSRSSSWVVQLFFSLTTELARDVHPFALTGHWGFKESMPSAQNVHQADPRPPVPLGSSLIRKAHRHTEFGSELQTPLECPVAIPALNSCDLRLDCQCTSVRVKSSPNNSSTINLPEPA